MLSDRTEARHSRWQGWEVWVIGFCLAIFGDLWLLQLSEGPLLNRSLFAGAGVGSDVVLPVALATTILIAGAAFLWMLAKNIATASATRSDSWKLTLGRSIVPTIAVVLLLRTFVVTPFWSVTDSSAPEIPRGSLVLVWKLSRTFAEGELIAYAENGHVNIGRVAKPSQEEVFVRRNNSEPASILHSDIAGKVISVIWHGTSTPCPRKHRRRTAAHCRTRTSQGFIVASIRTVVESTSVQAVQSCDFTINTPPPILRDGRPRACVQPRRRRRRLEPGSGSLIKKEKRGVGVSPASFLRSWTVSPRPAFLCLAATHF